MPIGRCLWLATFPFHFTTSLTLHAGSDAGKLCDWRVYYNVSVDISKPVETLQNMPVIGLSCLQACCYDVDCAGIAIKSSLQSQCYKYSSIPTRLSSSAPLLTDFVTHGKATAWSFLLKTHAARGSQTQDAAQRHPALIPAFHASGINEKPLQEAANQQMPVKFTKSSLKTKESLSCKWSVYYNHSAVKEGYLDGAMLTEDERQCMHSCCEDEICHGFALEPGKPLQCYLYRRPPEVVNTASVAVSHDMFQPKLGPAWTLFMKKSAMNKDSVVVNNVQEESGPKVLLAYIAQCCATGAFIILILRSAYAIGLLPCGTCLPTFVTSEPEHEKLLKHRGTELLLLPQTFSPQ